MAEIRPYYVQNRSWLKDIVPLSSPFGVGIEPTRACNFKCYYCMHSTRGIVGGAFEKMGLPTSHMEQDVYDKLVAGIMAFPQQPKVLHYTGYGEPLLNPRLEEMVEKMRRAGYQNKINVTTNGSLLTPRRCENLVEAGVTNIIISLQGLCSQTYEKNCGAKVDFDGFVGNVQHLFKVSRGKTHVTVKIIDKLLNENETKEVFYKTFDEICDIMHIDSLTFVQPGTNDFECLQQENRELNVYGKKKVQLKTCPIMFYICTIDAKGNVFPCTMFLPPSSAIGNLQSESLSNLFGGKKHIALLKANLKHGYKTIPMCNDCERGCCVDAPEDLLDDHAQEILERLENLEKEKNG